MQLAFIGLGVMGYPMAGHLQQKAGAVRVYNRTRGKSPQMGGRIRRRERADARGNGAGLRPGDAVCG